MVLPVASHVDGRREMLALDQEVRRLGLWLLLERPGSHPDHPTFRLVVRKPRAAIRSRETWVRRNAKVRPMSGRNLAEAATALLADLKSDPPQA